MYIGIGFLFFTIFLFHGFAGLFVPFLETSSLYWALSRERKINWEGKVLVLGDSQVISGITPEMVAEWESISVSEVIYLPRPSDQPEGFVSQYYQIKDKTPNLRKIYLNLSPISLSKNSVVQSHKQLFVSFGKLFPFPIENKNLRALYFPNFSDLVWKCIIEVFPIFSFNSNTSSLISKWLLGENITEEINLRQKEFDFLHKKMTSESGAWVWKDVGDDKSLSENEEFPKGSTIVFSGKRDSAIELLNNQILEWQKKKLEVVILRIPFSPKMEVDIEETKGNQVFDQFLQNSTALATFGEGKEIQFLDLRESVPKKEKYFVDITHLNQKGRDVLRKTVKGLLFDKSRTAP